MKRLFNGDIITATADFHKCLATEEKTFTEYQFAQAELKALGQPPSAASSTPITPASASTSPASAPSSIAKRKRQGRRGRI
jgi:hypothetical protein